jgi:hypothetical protein
MFYNPIPHELLPSMRSKHTMHTPAGGNSNHTTLEAHTYHESSLPGMPVLCSTGGQHKQSSAFAGAPVPLSAISNAARSKTALKRSRMFSKSSQVHRASRQQSASGCPIKGGGRRSEWKNRGKEEQKNRQVEGGRLQSKGVITTAK